MKKVVHDEVVRSSHRVPPNTNFAAVVNDVETAAIVDDWGEKTAAEGGHASWAEIKTAPIEKTVNGESWGSRHANQN